MPALPGSDTLTVLDPSAPHPHPLAPSRPLKLSAAWREGLGLTSPDQPLAQPRTRTTWLALVSVIPQAAALSPSRKTLRPGAAPPAGAGPRKSCSSGRGGRIAWRGGCPWWAYHDAHTCIHTHYSTSKGDTKEGQRGRQCTKPSPTSKTS